MLTNTGPNSLTSQELDRVFEGLFELVEASPQEREKHAFQAQTEREQRRLAEEAQLAALDAADAARKAAAERRSSERAAERAQLDSAISDALTPLRSRGVGTSPAALASMRRWLAAYRSAPADNKFTDDADNKFTETGSLADETFTAPLDASSKPERAGRTTHYVSEDRERLFFKELRRRSASGHPFRDARDPSTGASASVLLSTPMRADNKFTPSADNKFPAPPFKTSPPWRDLSPRARAIYGIEAAKAGGRARAITVGLGDLIKAKAEHQQHGALRFIVKTIDRGLKKAFGTTPPLFVTLERSGDIGLHLHGVIELDDHQLGKVAELIRQSVGLWRERVDRQVEIKPIYSAEWGAYVTKFSAHARQEGRQGYYMGHDLRGRAEAIHKLDCDFMRLTGGLTNPNTNQN